MQVRVAINKTKRQPTEWENIFTKDTSNKGLVSKIYKQLTQTQHQKNKQSNLKMGKRLEQTLSQGGHTEVPEAYEKKLNITSHQRDAK